MNDLFFIKYEPKIMLVDTMDMPRDVELAHRRLCDIVWAMDGPPDDNQDVLMGLCRVNQADWVRIRGGLIAKGWKSDGGKFTHGGAIKTLAQAKVDHESKINRTAAARAALSAKRNTDCNKPCDTDCNRPQSESESESDSTKITIQQSCAPTLQEVKTKAAFIGMPEDEAERFWNHFESSGWVDKNGNPIHSWQAKLSVWNTNHRAAPIEAAHKAAENGQRLGQTTQAIIASKELDRVLQRITKLKDTCARNPHGQMMRQEDIAEMKMLKSRRGELMAQLGVKA